MNRNGGELEQVVTIQFKDRHGAASLRYRNRLEISVLCVNIKRYGFRASPRAIRYSVDVALFYAFDLCCGAVKAGSII